MDTFIDIPNYEGYYQISKSGIVKSVARWIVRNGYNSFLKERILKSGLTKRGYLAVILHKENKVIGCHIHALVAKTYIPNISNLPQINHKDGNKLNNHVDNLEWCTASQNVKHAYANNLITPSSKRNKRGKALNIQTGEIMNVTTAAITLGISREKMSKMLNGHCKNYSQFVKVIK